MDNINIETLALAVAQVEYYSNIIEQEKAKIRNLSTEEINKLNKNNLLVITPKDYTKTTYSNEYKTEVKKLKEKFPPTKETFANYSLELTPTSFTNRKAEELRKLANYNLTMVKRISASVNKEVRASKKSK